MHDFRAGIIYCITNKVNGKRYIGQTRRTLKERWGQHKYDAVNRRRQSALCRAMCKYGTDNFTIELLAQTVTPMLNPLERSFIEMYNTLAVNGHGYNLTTGGDSGGFHSTETRSKISKALKDYVFTDRQRNNKSGVAALGIAQLGHVVSIKTRIAVGQANHKRVITAETRHRMSSSQHKRYLRDNALIAA